MSVQIMINLIIAFLWMLLNNTYHGGTFIIGYLLGMALLLVLRRFLVKPLYFSKIVPVCRLFYIFVRELIFSNLQVAKEVVRPKLRVRPGIVTVPTELKTDLEITLFAALITLTPGTLVLNISDDGQQLYVHCMDIEDAQSMVLGMKETFEKAIMEVSR